MKPIKIVAVFLSILLFGIGCSQELLDQLLQKESEAEIDYETLGMLLAHICYDSVDAVFEQTVENQSFQWGTPVTNQSFAINRTNESGKIQETGSGTYSFDPTTLTLTASVTSFTINFLNDLPLEDENDRTIGSLKKGGAITVSNYTLQADFKQNFYDPNHFYPSKITVSNYAISGSATVDFKDSGYKDGTLKFENFKLPSVTINMQDPYYVGNVTVPDTWTGKITFGGEDVTEMVIDEFKWILPEVIERESED